MGISNYKSEIEEVYIYFKRIDTVISTKHVMDSDDFFDLFALRYGTDAGEWVKLNQKSHRGTYINMTPENKRLAYMFSYSVNANANEGINVVVIIDISNFLEMIEDVSIINNGKVAVIDKNDRLVISSKEVDLLHMPEYDGFKSYSSVQYTDSSGHKQQISYTDSNIEEWKYLYIMPTDEYWKQLGEYRKLVLTGISFSLVLSCIVALYLFKRNYEPIKRLITNLKSHHENDNDTIAVKANMLNGNSGMTIGFLGGNLGTWMNAMKEKYPSYELVASSYPTLNKGEKVKFAQKDWKFNGWSTAITTSCKNVELAARFLNYGYTEEGHKLYNYGIEGVSYEMVNGYPTYTDEIMNHSTLSVAEAMSIYHRAAYADGPFIQSKEYLEQYMILPQQKEALKLLSQADPYPNKYPPATTTPEEAQELATIERKFYSIQLFGERDSHW